MSRTKRQSKPSGTDFWSRRCFGCGCLGTGPIAKRITKKAERTRKKRLLRKALVDPQNVEGRFPGE